ncbi:MAG: AAA family ATPase [Planctomycetaceae bacterium]|nr:AAA family ATPase [Planctomycetaceae bacterium]
MRFLTVQLQAFGPFTNAYLDLSGGDHGLHLIYGSNEAGKSSSLRAITDLLYGIHSRTPDNFKHPYPRLRIAGELQHSDGTVLNLVRRKANKNSLFQKDDSTPLDENQLARLLGNVDRDLFHRMFGIDHERLREGGEEIVKGDGQIGQLLFAAGAGLADLQAIQKSLHDEMDCLLKKSGRSGAIASNIKEFKAETTQVKEALASVDTWKNHEENLKAAQSQKDSLDQSIATDQIEQNRLTRIRDSFQAIGQLKKAQEDLAQLSDAPLLPIDFDQASNGLLIQLRTTEQQQSDAETTVETLNHELSSLVVPTQLLQESDIAEDLRDRLGGYRKAMSDRPSLKTARQLAEGEASEILRELGRAPDLSTIEGLRIPTDKTVRIQNLGNQQEGLIARVDSTRRECETIRCEMERIEKRLSQIDIPNHVTDLQTIVRDFQNQGDLESQFDRANADFRELQDQATVALEQLGLWSGKLEDLEKLPVPSLATIERYSEQLKDQNGQLATLRDQRNEKHTRSDQLTGQLKQLELGQPVPTEQELQDARQLREQGWQLLLAQKEPTDQPNSDLAPFMDQFNQTTNLHEAYRRSVEEADRVADQLRFDADRVATKAKIQSDMEQLLLETEQLENHISQKGRELKKAEKEWNELWQPIGIAPLSPLEMRDWLRNQQLLVHIATDTRTQQNQLAELRSQIDSMTSELAAALAKVDPSRANSYTSLREALSLASSRCEEIQRSGNLLEQLSTELESHRKLLADAESRFREAEHQLSEWQILWSTEMNSLGLDNDAMPSQANSVLSNINRLFQKYQEADQYRVRLEGIDRDAKEFDSDVRTLVGRTAPELVEKDVEEAVGMLSIQLKEARAKSEQYSSLEQQLKKQQDKLQNTVDRISEFKASLDEMCRQAACESYEQLSNAAIRSRQRRDLEQAVNKLEDLISGQSGGATFDQFLAEAEACDIDSLPPRIMDLDKRLEQLGLNRDAVIAEIEAERIALRSFDGGSRAAENAATRESIAARLESQVEELAKLRICAAILNSAIEEHRKKHQGPVLSRASEIFRHTTLGAFRELRADFSDTGEPVLTGVRDVNDQGIPVSGMSDGTCDQLYLALRIASLESWLDRHEPIPFIVDDVLLNFDDERAAASLQVLGELSHRTQVVFFTHHQHLVDLSKQAVPAEQLFITTIKTDPVND